VRAMVDYESEVDRFRFRLGFVYFLKHSLAYLTAWAFVWGTAVLALRVAVGVESEPLLWGLAAVPVALVAAFMLARRQLPSMSSVRALIDRSSGCGGLLMAGEQVDTSAWSPHMPSMVEMPRVRWQGQRSWTLFAVAVAFVVVGFLVPERYTALAAEDRLEIDREVRQLAKQIDALKEEAVIDPDRAEALKQKLDQVQKDANGRNPAKTLEALDHMKDMVRNAARESAEKTTRLTSEFAKAETLAEALKLAGSVLPAGKSAEAAKELLAMAAKLAADNPGLLEKIDPEMMSAFSSAMKSGSLTPEQMKKLAEALKGGKKELAQSLEKLYQAKLIDLDALKECEKAGMCNGQALAEYFRKGGGKKSLAELMLLAEQRGAGGQGEDGPGKTPLTIGQNTTEEGVKFKEVALPPAALNQLKEAKLTGVKITAPKVELAPAQSGALSGANAGGGSANNQMILPQHRGAVQRYFDR
jgi:hypothetical protein